MDYIVRMEKEYSDLVRKIDKLNNFIKDKHKNLDSIELLLMIQQRTCMESYKYMLSERISYSKEKQNRLDEEERKLADV